MKNLARHHHYLPQFYLRGFSKAGGKKSKIMVIDVRNGNRYETNARNIGGVRDFNLIDIDGIESDAIEKGFSAFESEVALSLRRLEKTLSFDGEDRDHILNLIALLAIRSPEMRENWRKIREDLAKKVLDIALATKKRWESQISAMKKKGYDINSDITYEEMKEFHEGKRYEIEVSTEHHLQMEFSGVEKILPLLFARKWLLISATSDTGPFITTDRPVVLTWKEPEKIPLFFRQSPGFGMRDTQIQFPISRNISLIGEFEGKEGIIVGSKNLVALLNTKMIMLAFHQLYAPRISFKYIGQNKEIFDGSTVLTHFSPTGLRRSDPMIN